MQWVDQGQSLFKNEEYEDYVGQLFWFVIMVYYNNWDDSFWVFVKGYFELLFGWLFIV